VTGDQVHGSDAISLWKKPSVTKWITVGSQKRVDGGGGGGGAFAFFFAAVGWGEGGRDSSLMLSDLKSGRLGDTFIVMIDV